MAYIRKKYRLSLRTACIELGRKCNFKCRHCFQGESQDVAITPDIINAICDNVLWIDELHFVGGEPMLYVDELRMILKIFKKRRIRVNYLGITTNMSMRSQEFADVYNEWADYITRPDQSGFDVSVDPFHLEFITKKQIEQNIAFYREKCPSLKQKERIHVFDNAMENSITITGRAENLTLEDFKKCNMVTTPLQGIGKNMIIPIKEKCIGKKSELNRCNYKCVKNCTKKAPIEFLCDGSIQRNDVTVTHDESKKRGFIMGNILKDNLYNSIMEFNKKCEKMTEDSTSELIFFNEKSTNTAIKKEVICADHLTSIGKLSEAVDHLDRAMSILCTSSSILDDEKEKHKNKLDGQLKILEFCRKIKEMQEHNTYGHIL
jgi:hypothetical protein